MDTKTYLPFTIEEIDGYFQVLTGHGHFFAKTVSSADAKLIAAAPEMLAALQLVRGRFRPGIANPADVAAWDAVKSAIETATA